MWKTWGHLMNHNKDTVRRHENAEQSVLKVGQVNGQLKYPDKLVNTEEISGGSYQVRGEGLKHQGPSVALSPIGLKMTVQSEGRGLVEEGALKRQQQKGNASDRDRFFFFFFP